MRDLRIYTDGKPAAVLKQSLLLISVVFMVIPAIVSGSGLTAPPAIRRILWLMSLSGSALLTALALSVWLLSRFSPVEGLKIRKKLILFTQMFLHSEEDGALRHCVRWQYGMENGRIKVILYPNGLEKDTADIARRLSEYLEVTLLKYEEADRRAYCVFGCAPERYNGLQMMKEGIAGWTGSDKTGRSYEPVPIYDGVVWDFVSEALHILLLAPSGAGKTCLLKYLCGMVLNRGHSLYVIDAKNSDFGMLFRQAGVRVATTTGEIIQLLTELVEEMEKRYYTTFYTYDPAVTDFKEKGMQGHFLIFDEILSVLSYADKDDKKEIERLLGQLALKGRAAGFSIVITAQKLNAADLPKAITEQCQTRIILGQMVSDETFHQATNMYKKDVGSIYRGDVGKGYAVTPKTGGLTYIETPLLSNDTGECLAVLRELMERGNPYGEGR